ncbi:Eco57I restriction-modification methylase domain-containing protein, partial [Candidatus Synechococcus spongiarum]
GHLARRLAVYSHATSRIIRGDYIHLATAHGLRNQGYTHVILNSPYKKISSHSAHRLALHRVGIKTVNLYSAFVGLAVAEAAPGGQIVAIIPHSFCSGPYYRPFRDFILARSAIRQMHLFASRNKPFKGDEVLQETIIIRLERGGQQGPVTVSTSTEDSFADFVTHDHPFERVVFPHAPEQLIHVLTTPEKTAIERLGAGGLIPWLILASRSPPGQWLISA